MKNKILKSTHKKKHTHIEDLHLKKITYSAKKIVLFVFLLNFYEKE